VAPEIARRLSEIAADTDESFALAPNAMVLWRGHSVAELVGGGPFAPKLRLLGEGGPVAARERAARRLESFVAGEAREALGPLEQLKAAVADGRLEGLARGLGYQIVENFGLLDRKDADEHIRALWRHERKALKDLGVRFGAFSLYLPGLLTPETRWIREVFAELARPGWRPAAGALTPLPNPLPPPESLALRGLRAIVGLAAPVEALERIDAFARAAEAEGGFALTEALLAELSWTKPQAERVTRALGYVPARKNDIGEVLLWRRRGRPTPRRRRRQRRLSRARRRVVGAEGRRRHGAGYACQRTRSVLSSRRLALARALLQNPRDRRQTRDGRRSDVPPARRRDRGRKARAFGASGRRVDAELRRAPNRFVDRGVGERRGPANEARELYSLRD